MLLKTQEHKVGFNPLLKIEPPPHTDFSLLLLKLQLTDVLHNKDPVKIRKQVTHDFIKINALNRTE